MHFVVRFWGTPMRDTNSNPSDCLEIWRAIVNHISEHIPYIFGGGFRGTRNPIPPTALEFDVPLSITFLNTFHAFSGEVSEDTKPNPSDCPGIWRAFVNYISEHIPSIFGIEVSEGHETQSLRLPWNLTCLCQLHFWTHSMHFRGRFPRDTKPNPSDCPGIWRAFVNYISEHIPSIFGVGFRGTRNPIPPIALKFDVPWPITFSNAFHAFSW